MIQKEINQIKIDILKTAYQGNEGHVASSFSIVDILYVLYDKVLNLHIDNLSSNDRNFLVLSKGHASLGHAAILAYFNFIEQEQLFSYCKIHSILGGHLDRKKVPGVEVSTGSLGHGLSVAIGIALAAKIKKIENHTYVVIGDGECNEGTFWEALLLGANHKLDNLTFIIDYNRSNDRALKLDPFDEKLRSFGWSVEVVNGHDHAELERVFKHQKVKEKPRAVIANTVKGNGVKIMENNPEWHHKVPTIEQLNFMIEELKCEHNL